MKEAKKEKARLRALAECAIMVALAFVLSMIKVGEAFFPYGGSITILSMLPICVAALRNGPLWGLSAAFIYSITQALMSGAAGWGLTPTVLVVCFLLDYILAFTVLGLCGFMKQKGTLLKVASVVAVCVLRFICHYLSGITIWANSIPEEFIAQFGANPYLYSLLYNGGYMLPEAIFTALGAFFVIKALQSRKLL